MKLHVRFERLGATLAVLAPLACAAAPTASAAGCAGAAPVPAPGCPGASVATGRPMTGGMLTREAHEEHLRRMASFKTYEECRAYMDDWRARTLSQGRGHAASVASAPVHDECDSLPHGKP